MAFDPEAAFCEPVFEKGTAAFVEPATFDKLLAAGWRNFGTEFFRHSHAVYDGRLCGVLALRLDATAFAPPSGLRRTIRKNMRTQTRIIPARHQPAYDALFKLHRSRFRDSPPDRLTDFLSEHPDRIPCPVLAFELRVADRLAAVSFLALGKSSTSGVYAMFDPEFSDLRPGMYSMSQEIAFTASSGRRWYYPGYAYSVPSSYDYKLTLPGLQAYDWSGEWHPFVDRPSWSRTPPTGLTAS